MPMQPLRITWKHCTLRFVTSESSERYAQGYGSALPTDALSEGMTSLLALAPVSLSVSCPLAAAVRILERGLLPLQTVLALARLRGDPSFQTASLKYPSPTTFSRATSSEYGSRTRNTRSVTSSYHIAWMLISQVHTLPLALTTHRV